MSAPLAYFITFHTYGTWLHGHARGSVDVLHNRPGTPYLPADAVRATAARSLMKYPEMRLSVDAQRCVTETIREVCMHRNWRLHAVHVLESHVHVVVTSLDAPEKVMSDVKAWCSRRLREQGHVTGSQRVWSDHGSTRYLNTPPSLAGEICYTLYEQGKRETGTFWP